MGDCQGWVIFNNYSDQLFITPNSNQTSLLTTDLI